MTSDKVTHLIKWDMHVNRTWSPVYYFTGERSAEEVPPFIVSVSAEFDHNDAAVAFQKKVMEILEGM